MKTQVTYWCVRHKMQVGLHEGTLTHVRYGDTCEGLLIDRREETRIAAGDAIERMETGL